MQGVVELLRKSMAALSSSSVSEPPTGRRLNLTDGFAFAHCFETEPPPLRRQRYGVENLIS